MHDPLNEKPKICLSLISHTNNGKTTLARTLLRQDVGDVGNAAHLTLDADQHVYMETDQGTLILWDTPGFGHVGKLITRLRREKQPFGWLMNHLVDRLKDRAGYCSLQAAKNIHNNADVVLYVVNSREKPKDAGYVPQELELIKMLQKPTIIVLTQLSSTDAFNESKRKKLIEDWQKTYGSHALIKGVLILDGHLRSNDDEGRLLELLQHVLPEKAQLIASMRELIAQRQTEITTNSAHAAAMCFWKACRAEKSITPDLDRAGCERQLIAELQAQTDSYLDSLLSMHNIMGDGRVLVKRRVREMSAIGSMSENKFGTISSILTGAASGLAADLVAGGLTLGGGVLVGTALGFFGGKFGKRAFDVFSKNSLRWGEDELVDLFRLLLRYFFLVAQHGRGRGVLEISSTDDDFSFHFDELIQDKVPFIRGLIKSARNSSNASPGEGFEASFFKIFADVLFLR